MKYALVTFGCRVNQADSLALEAQLRAKGATQAAPEDADVVVVNSCSVTATADQGTRQVIRRIVRANPDVQVVVTGCYATREPDEVRALPNVLHVVPNDRKDSLADLFVDGDGPCGQPIGPGLGGRTALTLRVQTGCEEACSYCIIPRTRGGGRSRPLASVLADLHRAVGAGYKEIVITGVHLGSYGRDLGDGASLTALVRALAEWPDDVLFRISSLEPMDCTDAIVDLVASSPRLAPHFHLPLQHGSDEMLSAMRRPYTVSCYRGVVDRIRTLMPDASIGSDMIVGFPGETAAHVDETLAVLERLPLTHLHVFPYSDRPGTAASAMQPKVDGRDIRDRGRQVRAIGEQMTRRFRESQAGRTRRALTVDHGWSAVTDNYIKVRLGEHHERNEWVDVTV
ncbi:MAG: MiaB/RimO family radical SAM methylthiotransferase [Acidimicrobiia bacterium]|nr:MiaB/RimO family radical SAM methylthiotransferase [Acidimicrobiia bacterium]